MVGKRNAVSLAAAILTLLVATGCAGVASTASPPPPAVTSVAPSSDTLTPAPSSSGAQAAAAASTAPSPSLVAPNESMDPALTGLWTGRVDLVPSRTDSAIGMSAIPWLTTVMLGQCTSSGSCGGWSNAGLNTSGWGIGCTSSLRYGGTDQGAFVFDETSTLKYGAITQCMGDCRLYLTPTAIDTVDIRIGCRNHGYRFDAEGSLDRVGAR